MRVRRGGAYDHLQPVGSCDAQLLRCFSSEDGRKLTCLNRPPRRQEPPPLGGRDRPEVVPKVLLGQRGTFAVSGGARASGESHKHLREKPKPVSDLIPVSVRVHFLEGDANRSRDKTNKQTREHKHTPPPHRRWENLMMRCACTRPGQESWFQFLWRRLQMFGLLLGWLPTGYLLVTNWLPAGYSLVTCWLPSYRLGRINPPGGLE